MDLLDRSQSTQDEANTDKGLELERFREDQKNAEREHSLRLRELALKEEDSRRSKWTNPFVLAVVAACLAGLGNAYIAWLNGENQNRIESTKNAAAKEVEQQKAEAIHILEATKEAAPEKRSEKLRLLVDLGLIADPNRQAKLEAYIKGQQLQAVPPSASPSLPTPTPVVEEYQTGWLGGGNSREDQCRIGRLSIASKYPDRSILLVATSEQSKKDILGRVEYMYFCTFKIE